MNNELRTLGVMLVNYRHSAGLTQGQLRDRIGRSCHAISNWENGHRTMTLSDFLSYCEQTGADPADIVSALMVQRRSSGPPSPPATSPASDSSPPTADGTP